MKVKIRLRNSLIHKIQHLSTDKLKEVINMLNKIESDFKSKNITLQFAGSWKEMNEDFIIDMTEKLHENRSKDREIE